MGLESLFYELKGLPLPLTAQVSQLGRDPLIGCLRLAWPGASLLLVPCSASEVTEVKGRGRGRAAGSPGGSALAHRPWGQAGD